MSSQVHPHEQPEGFPLLQLPGPALSLVLQQLDQCSLASTAASCSSLRHAALANTSRVAVHCRSEETLGSFMAWLDQNSTSLTKLTNCSILDPDHMCNSHVDRLPCPQLRQLRLQHSHVQLEAAAGWWGPCPGVLHDLTALTALDVQDCRVEDTHAVLTAIAALSELRSLRLPAVSCDSQVGKSLLSELQHPSKLTYLSVGYHWEAAETEPLGQLSALVNLKHLELTSMPNGGVPGGLPSQLVKLTCLHVSYPLISGLDIGGQLQHLSCLTALQQLAVRCFNLTAGGTSGIQHLSHLSSLEISSFDWEFSVTNTSSWTSLAALESLSLGCKLQPQALAVFTKMRRLTLKHCRTSQRVPTLRSCWQQCPSFHC